MEGQGRLIPDTEFEAFYDHESSIRMNPVGYVVAELERSDDGDSLIQLDPEASAAVLGTYARITGEPVDPMRSALTRTIDLCLNRIGKSEKISVRKDMVAAAITAIKIDTEKKQ